jgi:hypothetical protein
VLECVPVELAAHDGGPLDQRALGRFEPIQPTGKDRRHAGWDDQVVQFSGGHPTVVGTHEDAVVDEHADQFLDEERVPVGGSHDASAEVLG